MKIHTVNASHGGKSTDKDREKHTANQNDFELNSFAPHQRHHSTQHCRQPKDMETIYLCRARYVQIAAEFADLRGKDAVNQCWCIGMLDLHK